MKDSSYQSVCNALSRQLGRDPDSFQAGQTLRGELGLDAIDLDMIALWLEESEGIEIPSASITQAKTVGQLTGLLRAWKRKEERDDAAERSERLWHFIGELPRAKARRAAHIATRTSARLRALAREALQTPETNLPRVAGLPRS